MNPDVRLLGTLATRLKRGSRTAVPARRRRDFFGDRATAPAPPAAPSRPPTADRARDAA